MKKNPLSIQNEIFQQLKKIRQIKFDHTPLKGLTPRESELVVLLALNLDAENDSISVSELSSLLQITPAGVTHLLNPLEAAGCIQRLRDPNDRRVVLISLTNEGYQLASDLITDIQEKLDGLMEYLGKEDSQTLVCLMAKVVDFLTT